jgi:FkbM family methyltransferase
MQQENMFSIKINNKDIYYYESNDPVIAGLKSNVLFGKGNYDILKEFILNDGIIVDCGAHIGTFAFTPVLSENKEVILVEAANKNYECLKKTFANSKAHVYKEILLDKEQPCNFSEDYGPFGSVGTIGEGISKSTTLDSIILNNHAGKNISAIKFDIEGNEGEALIGSKNILEKYHPPMLIEINGSCLLQKSKKPKDIFDVLDSFGYKCFIPQGENLIPINKNNDFPFCVLDVIAIYEQDIYKYIDKFLFLKSIDKSIIRDIMINNYNNSNQDCKNYFKSISPIFE